MSNKKEYAEILNKLIIDKKDPLKIQNDINILLNEEKNDTVTQLNNSGDICSEYSPNFFKNIRDMPDVIKPKYINNNNNNKKLKYTNNKEFEYFINELKNIELKYRFLMLIFIICFIIFIILYLINLFAIIY